MKKSTILSSLAIIALTVSGAGFANAYGHHSGHCGNMYHEPAPYQDFRCDNPNHHNGMYTRGECFVNIDPKGLVFRGQSKEYYASSVFYLVL